MIRLEMFCDFCNSEMRVFVQKKDVPAKVRHPGYFGSMTVDTAEELRQDANVSNWDFVAGEDKCPTCISDDQIKEQDDEFIDDEVSGQVALDLAELDVNDLIDPQLEALNQQNKKEE